MLTGDWLGAAGSNQVFFGSDEIKAPSPHTVVTLANLTDGSQRQLTPSKPLPYYVGSTPYKGQLMLAVRSDKKQADSLSGLILFNYTDSTWSWALNNFLGVHFNGPNDLIALSDGAIIFTDDDYARYQNLATDPQIANYVWYWQPADIPRPLIHGLVKPNGLALSADEKTLYVGDSGASYGMVTQYNETLPRQVYQFDLTSSTGGVFATNKRLFATVANGIADGIKLDVDGNVYTSSFEGVQVFSPAGKLIGKIILPITEAEYPAVANFVFAGSKLVILHRTEVLVLQTNTSGLAYASA